jgi:hypothetical protein
MFPSQLQQCKHKVQKVSLLMDEADWRGIDSTQDLKTNLKEKKFFAAS